MIAPESNLEAAVVALQDNTSRIVPLALSGAFLLAAGLAHVQNGVIREQADTLALYERGAKTMVKSYESASLRASMALAAYDRCRGLQVVAAL